MLILMMMMKKMNLNRQNKIYLQFLLKTVKANWKKPSPLKELRDLDLDVWFHQLTQILPDKMEWCTNQVCSLVKELIMIWSLEKIRQKKLKKNKRITNLEIKIFLKWPLKFQSRCWFWLTKLQAKKLQSKLR